MNVRSLVVLSCLLAALPAQQRGGKAAPIQQDPQSAGEAELGDDGQPLNGDRKPPKLTKEQRDMIGVRRSASNFCHFHLATRPSKLMPGETGTLVITAILKGNAVIPSPAPLEIKSAAQQGVFTLGAHTVLPAELGRHASAYIGRAVYDNWATIEMPISVSNDAKVGQQHSVVVEMKFDLFDGKSAQSIGSFLDRAMGRVEIGRSFDPAVRGGYTPPDVADAGTPAPVANQPDAIGAAKNEPVPDAVGAAKPLPVGNTPAAADPTPTSAGPGEAMPKIEDDDGGLWILIAGGGALALAVLLLVFRRR
ncbi:MAG: hypothetical protein NXI31_15720 [bacterium]|nr:hypothetical protein [bacterium]